ncbi:LapA family protein [Xanthomonas vasicola]|uniref:Membrane protein n=1 Tax=Xanthomonas vasicola pv. vasculorum NCPPB 890 TaxID=1184265 RepID=A0A836ZQ12_XANVA|nr:LapA family protein [Xanthomonas vasicola]KFA27817.1 membrane protein [Xanthomonas vasicola pv. vasculorum NCPPB 1381]KFA31393.1 membrane protein [Xanthomonas vasicola pv. vasculorum NCPPB 1326]MBV6745760.1 LapA family protein [Xanthomonas vasicola pv. vasculorum NCPPB 890]MBV6891940.1 LapA family protein [Xanthomonas vasicola pv. vasculorum]MDO6947429.1 LapA family protein [Xanthomonas vasicola]
MKVLRLLVMLAFLLVGLIIGAVNSQDITLDFLFSSVHTSSGGAIIVALLVGVLIGAGMVLVSVVIPLYSKLRQANKAVAVSRADARAVTPAAVEPRPIDGL